MSTGELALTFDRIFRRAGFWAHDLRLEFDRSKLTPYASASHRFASRPGQATRQLVSDLRQLFTSEGRTGSPWVTEWFTVIGRETGDASIRIEHSATGATSTIISPTGHPTHVHRSRIP